jgi:hypothetical protein
MIPSMYRDQCTTMASFMVDVMRLKIWLGIFSKGRFVRFLEFEGLVKHL